MRTVRIRLWCGIAALALATSPAVGESVTFYFAPPAGAEFVAREIQASEMRIGAKGEKHTTALLTTVRVEREAGGTYVSQRYDKIAGAREGEAFETPPQIAAMQGSRIVHVLRPDGSLKRIDGYAQIAAKALPLMKPEAKASLEKMIAEGRQDARDRAAWYELEILIGQTLELDRDYWYDAAWSDEAGWMRHQTLVRLGPWVEQPGVGRLLTVSLAYVPNALAHVPAATRLLPKVATQFNPEKPGKIAAGQKFEGSASWLIDPSSMVVWKLQVSRKVSQPMQVNSELGVTFVTEEKATKTLEHAPSPTPGRP